MKLVVLKQSGWSQQIQGNTSNPPTQKKVLNIWAYHKPLSAKFYPAKGSLYTHMCTKFWEFTLKFNEVGVYLVHMLTLHITQN